MHDGFKVRLAQHIMQRRQEVQMKGVLAFVAKVLLAALLVATGAQAINTTLTAAPTCMMRRATGA